MVVHYKSAERIAEEEVRVYHSAGIIQDLLTLDNDDDVEDDEEGYGRAFRKHSDASFHGRFHAVESGAEPHFIGSIDPALASPTGTEQNFGRRQGRLSWYDGADGPA